MSKSTNAPAQYVSVCPAWCSRPAGHDFESSYHDRTGAHVAQRPHSRSLGDVGVLFERQTFDREEDPGTLYVEVLSVEEVRQGDPAGDVPPGMVALYAGDELLAHLSAGDARELAGLLTLAAGALDAAR